MVGYLSAENTHPEYVTLKTMAVKSPVQNIRFSPDGKWLAAGSQNGYVTLWEVETGKLLRRFWAHNKTVNEVTFSRDGKLLASAGADGLVNIWNLETGNKMGVYRVKKYLTRSGQSFDFVSFVDFSKDGKFVYFGGDSGYIMSAEVGKRRSAKMVYSSNHRDGEWYFSITGGTVSEDGKSLIFCVGRELHQIDLQDFYLKQKLHYHKNPTSKSLHFNDVVTGPFLNGVATWTYDGRVTFWDLQTGKEISSMQVSDNETYSAAAFDKTRSLMATGASESVAKVWDLQRGRQIATLKGHTQEVRMTRFHPHKHWIATASTDGTIRIWGEKPEEEIPPALASIRKIDPVQMQKQTDIATKKTSKMIFFQGKLLEKGETINLKKVRFERGSYILQTEGTTQLQELVELMLQHKDLIIRLEGHTDNVGDPHKNKALARRRVLAAKNYLIMKGVYEQRIDIQAYGGEKPIAPNDTEENRQKNRRIELKILDL